MKRIRLMILRNIFLFPYLYIKLAILARFNKFSEVSRYAHLRFITSRANKGGRVTIISSGEENLPKEGGYMLYPNHQGMYDVLAIIATHKRPFAVVMKKELEKIPLLNKVFQAMGAIAIDREDIRQSMQVINEVGRQVKDGRIFLIFAEGTRSKNGNTLGDFKGGSFKSAYKAQCPIVPVALVDSFVPFDVSHTDPVTVRVIYLPPIPYEEYKDMKTTQVAALVQERIQCAVRANESPSK